MRTLVATVTAVMLGLPGQSVAANASLGLNRGFFERVRITLSPNALQKQIGVEGGRLELADGATLRIPAGVLNTDTPVYFARENSPDTSFPDGFDNFYPLSDRAVYAVGPALKIELPRSSLNLDEDILLVPFPSLPDATPECRVTNTGCGAEVRIRLEDGSYSFYLDQLRGSDNGLLISSSTLSSLQNVLPETLEIQIRPVDFSNWTTTNPPRSGQALTSQQQTYYEDVTGLYALGENYNHREFGPSCGSMPQTMPVGKATAADVPDEKTPLILIHGYQAADNILFSPDPTTPKQFSSALCGWEKVIELFAREGNYPDDFNFHNLPQNILEDEYELFVFGFDSSESFATQADLLAEALSIFGGKEVVLVAYSMGGVLAKDYVQNHDNNVKRVISLSTPYMGTPVLVCEQPAERSCRQAGIHPLINRDVVGQLERYNAYKGPTVGWGRDAQRAVANRLAVLPAILSYSGTRDAAYQFPTTYYTPVSLDELEAVQVHPSGPNPYLTNLNSWRIDGCRSIGLEDWQVEDTCTVQYDASVNGDTGRFNAIVTSVAATAGTGGDFLTIGSQLSPAQRSDELTTLQSACVGLRADDCSASPFDAVIIRPDLDHLSVKGEPVLPLLALELHSVR